jgi:t-SNARE complex subunit (syntaxin)
MRILEKIQRTLELLNSLQEHQEERNARYTRETWTGRLLGYFIDLVTIVVLASILVGAVLFVVGLS